MKALHQLMLFQYLAADVLTVRILAIKTVKGKGNKLRVVHRRIGNQDAEKARIGIGRVPGQLSIGDPLLFQHIDQRKGHLDPSSSCFFRN